MQSAVASVPADLVTQLANKEREWKELQSLRAQQLEGSLKEAQEELYSVREEEMSQLRIQVAKLEEQRDRDAKEREEVLRHSQHRAAEQRLQLERLQSSTAGDIQKQREEYEQMKRDLQRRILELEGELALQRQEMRADFDNELRLQEHAFNLRMDEMRAVVLSHELKVKLLSKETEVHSQAQLQAVEALQASKELCQQTKAQLQQQAWEIRDMTAVKNNRIKELEDNLEKMQSKLKKEEDNHIKKHEDLDRALRQRDGQLDAQRRAHTAQLQKAEEHIAKLQGDLETAAAQTRRAQEEHRQALEQRDERIERLRTEVETVRSGWDKYIHQVSKETVVKDTELLALQEREAKLRTELGRSREDVERYKQQLSAGVDREKALEQRRVQVELEWQRRCEDANAEHYLASEQLIQGLTQARDQAQAELKERDREMRDLAVLLRSITTERDQALQGSRLSPGDLASEEIRQLQQQNASLRAVVAQMRRDMESLTQPQASPPQHPLPPDAPVLTSTTHTTTGPSSQTPVQPADHYSGSRPKGTSEYTQALEQEVSELKARCRHLEETLEGATEPLHPTVTDVPAVALAPVSPDNAYMQNHIRALNETIGGLRVEKVANAAALKKQAVRVAHLEAALSQLTQQCHAKQLEGEELRLELANQKRTWASEEAGLRQRLVIMEMELEEVRKEKDEYHKGNILNNLETVALGNQVSALKLDIASRREPIVCEQSDMVRQVQEQNLHLRQQLLASGLKPGGLLGDVQGAKLSAPLLQSKLKQAARCIARLTRDKQQLIEMGNCLRAQLNTAGLQVTPTKSMEPKSDSCRPEDQQGRLSALEQLQYQLTTQELQYAQREQRPGTLLSTTDTEGRRKNGAANPWGQGHQDTARHEHSRSKENTPPLLSQSQGSPHLDVGSHTPSSPSGPLLSSVATEGSLREVWQMLDRGLSPSLLTEGEAELSRQDLAEPSSPGVQVRVQGVKAPVQEKRKPTGMSLSSQTSKTKKTAGTAGRIGKIRNYNIKD